MHLRPAREGGGVSNEGEIRHPIAISLVMVNFGAKHGVDAETCLADTGISLDQLHDPEALIERRQEMRLVENLMLALPDHGALGFELGLHYGIANFGAWGFVLRTSRTVREAMLAAIRYLPLSTAYCAFSTHENADEFGMVADPSAIPQHLRQVLLERDTATAVQLFHELGFSGFRIKRIEYQGPAPDHAPRIEALCGIAPRYGSPRNVVVIRRQDADAGLPMYDAQLVRLLEDQCRAQLERRQITGLAGQVRRLLLGPLGLVTSLDDVAARLAMSPRSLRRKLEDEGSTFRELLDNERRQLAKQLLEGGDMKIDEMAVHLGYGDTASFTRAFRRWFDQAPREYRRTHTA